MSTTDRALAQSTEYFQDQEPGKRQFITAHLLYLSLEMQAQLLLELRALRAELREMGELIEEGVDLLADDEEDEDEDGDGDEDDAHLEEDEEGHDEDRATPGPVATEPEEDPEEDVEDEEDADDEAPRESESQTDSAHPETALISVSGMQAAITPEGRDSQPKQPRPRRPRGASARSGRRGQQAPADTGGAA